MKNLIEEIKRKNLKVCKHLDCRYAVSKSGDIYSLFSGRGIRKILKKIKMNKGNDGYLKTTFFLDNGRTYATSAHRLVATCFLGLNISDGNISVHHKNDNKTDNRVENLELMDRRKHNALSARNSRLKEIHQFDREQKKALLSI